MQTVVDGQHVLIVRREVPDEPADHVPLYRMRQAVREILYAEQLTMLVDSGCSNGERFRLCEDEDFKAQLPVHYGLWGFR